MTRALVVIDGEHYPPVVRDAIAELPYEVIGAWLAGGTEKLRGETGLRRAAARSRSTTASRTRRSSSTCRTSRCLGPRERMLLASRVLAAGSALRGRRLPLRAAAVRAVSAPVAGGDRYRETRREDRRHGSCRAAARTGSRRRRRGDGAGRTGGAGGGRSCSRRLSRCSTFRARAGTRRRTISRRPRSPGSSRSAAAGPAVGLRAR